MQTAQNRCRKSQTELTGNKLSSNLLQKQMTQYSKHYTDRWCM